jgi:hypothetical protein
VVTGRILAMLAMMPTLQGAKSMTNLNEMTKEQLIALVQAANQPKRLTMKVSEKGALSLYGLGRFPVTLYRGQWERLATAMPDIKVFISQNADLLAVKA